MPAIPTGETHCATLLLRHAQSYGREFNHTPEDAAAKSALENAGCKLLDRLVPKLAES